MTRAMRSTMRQRSDSSGSSVSRCESKRPGTGRLELGMAPPGRGPSRSSRTCPCRSPTARWPRHAELTLPMAVVARAPAPEAPSRREEEPRLDLRRRDFLSAADLTAEELAAVLDRAAELKAAIGPAAVQPLAGRTIALLFQKPSLRTRVSFELAVRRLGGDALHLGQSEVGLGVRESVEDVGRTLERWVDGVVARTFEQSVLERLASSCRVPVVNALTDLEHPCQALADLLTLRERFGRLRGLSIAFIGEGNNVFHSLALAGCALGLE